MSLVLHARIPGESCNAVSLEIARMVLVMLGYRIRRTTDHLEVYDRVGALEERPIVSEREAAEKAAASRGPRARLFVDEGAYYSHTWRDWDGSADGGVGTNLYWQETVDPCHFLQLVCAMLVPDYTPSGCGWIPDRGSDSVHIWWEATERLRQVGLPSCLSVGPRERG